MDLSIIFVNWNSLDYLRECIPSIYKWTRGLRFEVIVVDNASPVGDVDRLQFEFPGIKLIKSEKNLGFAGANNLGFKHSSADNILFLNPDTKLVSEAIGEMMRHLQSLPEAGIVGCKLLNADLSVQTSSIMKFPGIWNAILQIEYLRLRWPELCGIGPLFSSHPAPVEVEAISGACMLVRRDVFEQAGMFSEDYFMYSEDLDLCYQTIRAGFKNYYVGQASIVHYGGKSSVAERQNVMKTTSELRFCEKNYGRAYTLMFRIVLIFNATGRLAVLAIARSFRKPEGENGKLNSAWVKWRVILRTLLAHRTRTLEPSAQPNVVPSCGAPNV
jgi:GT2 family glycosyltransferase